MSGRPRLWWTLLRISPVWALKLALLVACRVYQWDGEAYRLVGE